jgi:hypothetical protein
MRQLAYWSFRPVFNKRTMRGQALYQNGVKIALCRYFASLFTHVWGIAVKNN